MIGRRTRRQSWSRSELRPPVCGPEEKLEACADQLFCRRRKSIGIRQPHQTAPERGALANGLQRRRFARTSVAAPPRLDSRRKRPRILQVEVVVGRMTAQSSLWCSGRGQPLGSVEDRIHAATGSLVGVGSHALADTMSAAWQGFALRVNRRGESGWVPLSRSSSRRKFALDGRRDLAFVHPQKQNLCAVSATKVSVTILYCGCP